MEAVPKVPMLHFNLKQTQQKASFSRLKQYIAEYYQENPDSFSKEIYELETLRAAAYNPSIDENGYNLIKRYYCQLHSLQNRFPIENDRNLVNFSWRDIYSSNTTQSSDIRHDMAIVLYNYGALHTQLAASANRTTEDDMKLTCTLFQRAAWAFETVRESYQMATTGDLYPELLIFMQNICFAQAQECILEKSLIDNRKAIIVAKVTAQIIEYYNSAFAALLSGGEEGVIAEIVGSKLFKEWRQYIQFRVQYMACILLLYQGQQAEEQQKMGERVTLYQAACDRLEDARKEAKHLSNMPQVNEALTFVMDVVEAKRKAAKNENEFIYHEEVPELSSIATVPGANLVKGIPFNVVDPAITAEDIFHRLIPIKTHENSSLYSEEKANLLRRITQKIEQKDNELNKFMESLSIDSLNYDPTDVRLPQALIDRCAEMNARPDAIRDLVSKMSSLAEICVDVENMLKTIQELLSKEEFYEKDFQQTMGYRPSSHFVELNREFLKYQEAHSKAGDSNVTLRKAMEMHVNNLKILSQPLNEVQAAIPTCSVEIDPKLLSETQKLLGKVNEMRVQRAQLFATLSENLQKDDITAQLIAWGENDVDKLFKTELAKHEQHLNIIEQNLVAQGNILKTFTDAYARCAHFIKTVSDTKHKRDIFFSSLIASFDVYDDLLGKSLKGLEFYKKLQNNIHKLCARVRSARDVHDEERQQRIESMNKKSLASIQAPVSTSAVTPLPVQSVASMPDYPTLPKTTTDYGKYDRYRSTSIRPTPIGQENPEFHPQCLVNQPQTPASYGTTNLPASNPNVALTTAYNYVTPSVSSSTVASQSFSQPQHMQTTVQSNTSNYSNQSNNYYNNNINSNARFVSSNTGFVNPVFNNLQTIEPPKSIDVSQISNTLANSLAPNQTSIASTQQYHFSGMNPTANISQNPPDSNYPMSSYSSHSQSGSTDVNSYLNHQYMPTQPATTTMSTYYAHGTVSNAYQPVNYNQNITPNTANQYYNVNSQSSQSNYAIPNQINNYQTPVSSQQYSQSNIIYSQPNTSMGFVEPQQIATPANMAYGGYSSTYSTQQQHEQQQPQYGAQFITPATSAYAMNTANVPNNQYSMPNQVDAYPTNNYAGQTSLGHYMPTNQSDLSYQYGVNGNAMGYTQIQQPTIPITPASMPSTMANNQTVNQTTTPKPPATIAEKPKPAKIDLLSDLDNISDIPMPILQPIKSTEKIEKIPDTPKTDVKQDVKAVIDNTEKSSQPDSIDSALTELTELTLSEEKAASKIQNDAMTHERKSSISSISSDSNSVIPRSTTPASVPPSLPNIENFYKEVQRYEKTVNILTTKTLNGTTPLDIKWKELHDMLEKDASKRTVNISKLFPEKNRNMLSVPFDHSRVLLPTETDNYINAAHIRDLGPHCSHFILADAPTYNTTKDFWCMIWSQNATCVVTLNTSDEAHVPLLPKQLNVEQTFGEYTVTVLSEMQRLYTIERSVRVTASEMDTTRTISILQPKQWPTKNSINNIIGVSQNVIDIMKSSSGSSPTILSCLTNLERSSLVALTVTCMMALETDTPVIINAIDIWYRICSQRKNILNDVNLLQHSMQIILQCCREYIKKKSPKTLTSNTQTNYYFIEEEDTPVKDPFKDLDPLWKLK